MSGPDNGTKDDRKSYKQEDLIVATDDQDDFVGVEKKSRAVLRMAWKMIDWKSYRWKDW